MNDRKLLELAAKAAGVNGQWSDYHNGICYSKKGSLDMHVWRPLDDDGDALRLAFSCGLGVDMYACWIQCEGEDETDYIEFEGGSLENVRRAIVRAAAAIGEAMQ